MQSFLCSEHPVLVEDLSSVASDGVIPWEKLHGKTVLVTGATGLIGSLLVKALLYVSMSNGWPLTVLAQVRRREKALEVFKAWQCHIGADLRFVEQDVRQPYGAALSADYIIHAASATASKSFIETPADVISTTFDGTRNVLELARRSGSESVVYLSSMEVYGKLDHELAAEADCGFLDPLALRSSYPQSKRMAETLCAAYAAQYGVHVKIVRPTMTFGAGVPLSDSRVHAQFARSALAGQDIVLHTAGMSKRDYLYTADAVRSIISVLLLGQDGRAYNLSNPETYATIRDMAELVAGLGKGCRVVFGGDEETRKRYPEEQRICLDTSAFDQLNPFPHKNLREMFERMMRVMEDERSFS